MPAFPYMGEIRIFAGDFAPPGWLACNGQALPISEYDNLFQLIGTTYGGDGESFFNLPNLEERVAVHAGDTHRVGSSGNASFGLRREQLRLPILYIIATEGVFPQPR